MTKRFRSLESAELKTQFLEKARPAKNGKPAPRRRQEKEIIQLIESMLNKSDFDFNFDVDEIKSSPLGQALKTPRLLSELLERKDLDVNLTDKEGKTVIFLAVESQLQPRKRIEILERFNKARVKIDTTDIHGRTPLLLAALLQQWDTVQFFVDEWDAGLDLEDNEKCTPLHYAITQGRADAVQYILQKKVNIDRRGHDDQTPLLTAIKLKEGTERTMIIKYLIESGANPNLKDCKQHTPLSYAVSHLDVEAFGQLLGSKDHAINVDHRVNGRTALSLAAECEAICIMKKLIPIAEINTQDDTTGRTPLTWAVEKGSKSAVTTLLEVRTLVKVDCPDHQGRTPFSVAASNGNVKIMSLLLDYGADPHIEDDESHSSFWWLLKSRTQEQTYPQTSLQDLIERLPDPDRQDSNGRTWLSWAAEYGDEEVVEQLLKNNKVRASQTDCVIGQIDTFARTPLIWAVEQSHYSLVSLITSTRKDKSSLIYLMKSSHVLGHERALDLFKKLLLFGDESITEDKDNEGNTPLHLICLREYHHFMKPLLAAKPVFFSRNHDGRMPLQVALDKRNKRAVDLLLELMNQVEIEPVKSVDWLKLGSGDNPWVWLSEIAPERGFRYDLTGKINYDMLSDNGPRRVCLYPQHCNWLDLPREFGAHDKLLAEERKSVYIQYINGNLKEFALTYISVAFPSKDNYQAGIPDRQDRWGISWVRIDGSIRLVLSKISDGWIPLQNEGPLDRFVNELLARWDIILLNTRMKIDELRDYQMEMKGRDPNLIDELANNASYRARLRDCLRSHIEKLQFELKRNQNLDQTTHNMFWTKLQSFENTASGKLREMELTVRELLQIEFAWASRTEAASMKRLNRITFFFLPMMLVSSLFGMNINLLEDNPDWRWFLLGITVSYLVTVALRIGTESTTIGSFMTWKRFLRRDITDKKLSV